MKFVSRTMAVFPASNGTRLVHLRALGGDFPFYGTMETAPPAAMQQFREGLRAVVDESLLFQFHASVGQKIKIGDVEFTIAGALKKIPGDASAGASFAPRVYIPLQNLEATHLIKPGSVARYRAYVKFPRKRRRRSTNRHARAANSTLRSRVRHG